MNNRIIIYSALAMCLSFGFQNCNKTAFTPTGATNAQLNSKQATAQVMATVAATHEDDDRDDLDDNDDHSAAEGHCHGRNIAGVDDDDQDHDDDNDDRDLRVRLTLISYTLNDVAVLLPAQSENQFSLSISSQSQVSGHGYCEKFQGVFTADRLQSVQEINSTNCQNSSDLALSHEILTLLQSGSLAMSFNADKSNLIIKADHAVLIFARSQHAVQLAMATHQRSKN